MTSTDNRSYKESPKLTPMSVLAGLGIVVLMLCLMSSWVDKPEVRKTYQQGWQEGYKSMQEFLTTSPDPYEQGLRDGRQKALRDYRQKESKE